MHSSRKETRTAARRTLPRYPGREPRCLFPTSTGCSSPRGPIPANRRPCGSSVQHLEGAHWWGSGMNALRKIMALTRMVLALALAGSPGHGWARGPGSEAPSYCSDLQRVTALAMTRERFASIAGKPREGNFLETSLALTGWDNCAL